MNRVHFSSKGTLEEILRGFCSFRDPFKLGVLPYFTMGKIDKNLASLLMFYDYLSKDDDDLASIAFEKLTGRKMGRYPKISVGLKYRFLKKVALETIFELILKFYNIEKEVNCRKDFVKEIIIDDKKMKEILNSLRSEFEKKGIYFSLTDEDISKYYSNIHVVITGKNEGSKYKLTIFQISDLNTREGKIVKTSKVKIRIGNEEISITGMYDSSSKVIQRKIFELSEMKSLEEIVKAYNSLLDPARWNVIYAEDKKLSNLAALIDIFERYKKSTNENIKRTYLMILQNILNQAFNISQVNDIESEVNKIIKEYEARKKEIIRKAVNSIIERYKIDLKESFKRTIYKRGGAKTVIKGELIGDSYILRISREWDDNDKRVRTISTIVFKGFKEDPLKSDISLTSECILLENQ